MKKETNNGARWAMQRTETITRRNGDRRSRLTSTPYHENQDDKKNIETVHERHNIKMKK
jgi:hypothetical protein